MGQRPLAARLIRGITTLGKKQLTPDNLLLISQMNGLVAVMLPQNGVGNNPRNRAVGKLRQSLGDRKQAFA